MRCREDNCNRRTSTGRRVSSVTLAVVTSETGAVDRRLELFGIFDVGLSQAERIETETEIFLLFSFFFRCRKCAHVLSRAFFKLTIT